MGRSTAYGFAPQLDTNNDFLNDRVETFERHHETPLGHAPAATLYMPTSHTGQHKTTRDDITLT